MTSKLLFIALWGIVIVSTCQPYRLYASTEVADDILESTTWTAESSPYSIPATIKINYGARLVIEPGVTIEFGPGVWIEVDGELIAVGTSNSKRDIIFKSADSAGDSIGSGSGLWVNGYFYTRYAKFIGLDSGVVFSMCHLSDGGFLGTVTHCTLEHNGTPFYLQNASAMLSYNLLVNNTVGLHNGYNGIPNLVNNTIVSNNAYGADLTYPCLTNEALLKNNIIVQNQSGITRGIISEELLCNPVLLHNNVWGNTTDYEGLDPDLTDISSDPLFMNEDSGDFRLHSDSPCIGAGEDETDIGGFYKSRGAIEGKAFLENSDTPLSGVSVCAGTNCVISIPTGHYIIENLKPGSYDVKISVSETEYRIVSNVYVSAGQIKNIDLPQVKIYPWIPLLLIN